MFNATSKQSNMNCLIRNLVQNTFMLNFLSAINPSIKVQLFQMNQFLAFVLSFL